MFQMTIHVLVRASNVLFEQITRKNNTYMSGSKSSAGARRAPKECGRATVQQILTGGPRPRSADIKNHWDPMSGLKEMYGELQQRHGRVASVEQEV